MMRMTGAALCLFATLAVGTAAAGDLSAVFAKVSPSVVVIHVSEAATPGPGDRAQTAARRGLGSGVLVSGDGKVMTAAHVVQTADFVYAEFATGEKIKARVAGTEPQADLALLELERMPEKPVVAKLGDSDKAAVGNEVFVVGAPYGLSHSLTVGHISARHEPRSVVGGLQPGEFFQTDAAINQGNSGGPMFNMAGEVIGIVSHILSRSGGFEGLGFATTSNTARALLLDQSTIWSGVDAVPLAGDMARVFNLPQPFGLLVQRVAKGSIADRAGIVGGGIEMRIGDERVLVGGDVILEVQGVSLESSESFPAARAALRAIQRGEKLNLKVLRAGEVRELSTYRLH